MLAQHHTGLHSLEQTTHLLLKVFGHLQPGSARRERAGQTQQDYFAPCATLRQVHLDHVCEAMIEIDARDLVAHSLQHATQA